MNKLLLEIESIVDLSNDETERIIQAFKQFIHRKFVINSGAMEDAFRCDERFLLNQQEDEDNIHSCLGKGISL